MAIDLLKEESVPKVRHNTLDLCIKGEEVTLDDPVLRAQLGPHNQSNGVHKVTWPGMKVECEESG